MIRIELSVAGCLLALYALFLVAMFVVLRSRASRRRKAGVGARIFTPQIRDALVDYLSGSNDQTKIREFAKYHRNEFVDALLEFHGTVGGSARDRLCDLALELALVHDWCQDACFQGPAGSPSGVHPSFFRVRLRAVPPNRRRSVEASAQGRRSRSPAPAARALVQSGGIEELGQVFRLAVSQSLLTRVLLSEDLRSHAIQLCERVIPEMLAADNPKQTVAALQILIAWERALPLPDLNKLLESHNRDVRLEALRLAKLVPLTPETRATPAAFPARGRRRGEYCRGAYRRPAEAAGSPAFAGPLSAHGDLGIGRYRRFRIGGNAAQRLADAAANRRRRRFRRPHRRRGFRPRAKKGGRLTALRRFRSRATDGHRLVRHRNRRVSQPPEGLFRFAAHRPGGHPQLHRRAPQIPPGAAVSTIAIPPDASPESIRFARRLLELHFGRNEVVVVLDGPSEIGMAVWHEEFHLCPSRAPVWRKPAHRARARRLRIERPHSHRGDREGQGRSGGCLECRGQCLQLSRHRLSRPGERLPARHSSAPDSAHAGIDRRDIAVCSGVPAPPGPGLTARFGSSGIVARLDDARSRLLG
jgi:hypothetical protein